MNGRDDFDGGSLLALFGFEDDEEPAQPAPAPETLRTPAAPPVKRKVRTAPPRRPPPTPPTHPSSDRGPLDLRNLSSAELMRSIVLADVLGAPPGRRARQRRR